MEELGAEKFNSHHRICIFKEGEVNFGGSEGILTPREG